MRFAKPTPMPNSWPLDSWPAAVFPNDQKKARYLFRANRAKLVACGAVTRVGRKVIFLGEGYSRFLISGMQRVDDFQIAPNALKQAA